MRVFCAPVSALRLTHVEVYLFRRRPIPRLLLLRRAAERRTLPGVWQPVTGHVRRGESALAAAAREVREETGASPPRWWTLEGPTLYFDPIDDCARVLPLFAAELGARARVRLSAEHDAFQFVSPQRASSLVLWDAQRAAIAALKRQLFTRARLSAALEITSRMPRRARAPRS